MGVPLNHQFNRIFHYAPAILGIPQSYKHVSVLCKPIGPFGRSTQLCGENLETEHRQVAVYVDLLSLWICKDLYPLAS